MTAHLHSPIVVGVDGSPDAERAVRYAVRLAEREGCGVLLVNAVHEIVPISPMWPLLTSDSLMDVGRGILADMQVLVEKISGATVPVELLAALGPAVDVLTEAGESARLIVLGHRGAGTIERIFTGATTLGVAARAVCPVVSVPREWHEHRAHLRVVAGIDGTESSRGFLASAIALASGRGARLDVVHCWELEPAYSALFVDASVAQDWRHHTSGIITALVDECSALYPDVVVETHLEYADVTRSLIAYSTGADVLCLGRHGHGGFAGRVAMSMPGSTARALIQHAHCPVELVPCALPVVPSGSHDDQVQAAAPVR